MVAEPKKIYAGEAAIVAPMAARPPDTYAFLAELRGNALISTIYVDDIGGATLAAMWKDSNPLTDELYPVEAHPPITTGGYHRLYIARPTHGTSTLEVVVSGGTPRFGVFVTANQMVGNFASPESTQNVTGSITTAPYAGEPSVMRSAPSVTTPNSTVVLSTATVPSGEAWQLRRLEAQCRAFGFFEVFIGATRVGRSLSGPCSENPAFIFDPFDTAPAGQTIEVRYTQSHGPIVDISAFLFLTVVAV